ncbi:hypothetical protein ABZV34_26055 [Streptomyces sp. NPDC005195]|uniref:hypothetical protein n=1 Tax=Streptomyces sp. NPDC005195 TaxID=3154561 RepID=UPI0033B7D47F
MVLPADPAPAHSNRDAAPGTPSADGLSLLATSAVIRTGAANRRADTLVNLSSPRGSSGRLTAWTFRNS